MDDSTYKVYRKLPNDTNIINHLGIYHPHRRGTNPNFDEYSQLILDLKNNNPLAIKYFASRIDSEILPSINVNTRYAITCVPPSDPEKPHSGVRAIIRQLNNYHYRFKEPYALKRRFKIESSHHGGTRSIETHLLSIYAETLGPSIRNHTVLLIDDVTTTHSSLLACQKILMNYGAKMVFMLALAQTVNLQSAR